MNLAASIVPLTAEHWPQVEAIYAAGIATGHATFETEPPDWEAFDAARLPDQRLVAIDHADRVLGWTAASAVSDRRVYAGVVEHSVYVDPAAQGRGIGRLLLDGLADSTEAAGIWTIQSGVFPENTRSLKLHRAGRLRGGRHPPTSGPDDPWTARRSMARRDHDRTPQRCCRPLAQYSKR